MWNAQPNGIRIEFREISPFPDYVAATWPVHNERFGCSTGFTGIIRYADAMDGVRIFTYALARARGQLPF